MQVSYHNLEKDENHKIYKNQQNLKTLWEQMNGKANVPDRRRKATVERCLMILQYLSINLLMFLNDIAGTLMLTVLSFDLLHR